MMDFLLKNKIEKNYLIFFISKALGIDVSKICIISSEEFYSTQYIDTSIFQCLCVFSFVTGDVKMLIQLFKIKKTNKMIEKKLIREAINLKIECYIPYNEFDEWIYINKDGDLKIIKELVSSIENEYLFEY